MGKQARLNAAKNAGKLDYMPYNPDDDLRFVDNTNYAPLPCGPVVTPEAQNEDNVIYHFPTESGLWTVLGPRNHMRRAEVVTSMHLYRGTSDLPVFAMDTLHGLGYYVAKHLLGERPLCEYAAAILGAHGSEMQMFFTYHEKRNVPDIVLKSMLGQTLKAANEWIAPLLSEFIGPIKVHVTRLPYDLGYSPNLKGARQ